MTWTYDNTALATSDKDAVRLIIGDTDTNAQLLANEEITWINKEITGSTTAITGISFFKDGSAPTNGWFVLEGCAIS